MKAEDFKGKEVTDQYGERVTIFEIVGNIARISCGAGRYHIDKLFHDGKSVFDWISEYDVDLVDENFNNNGYEQ